jgi:DNA polymerase-3 subunit delta
VNVSEFVAALGSEPPANIYLLCPFKGPKAKEPSFEPLLAQRAVEKAVSVLVDPGLRDLAYNAYYADEADAAEIASVAMTFPFLAERRLIVVNNAEVYDSESQVKPLLTYMESPSETTVLILVASRIDKRSKFYKACEKNGVVVECPELREHELMLWINSEVRARGKTIEPAAVEAVIGRAGNHLGDVNNAIQLVCSYIGDEPTVRAAHVNAACADVAEDEIWALTDAIAASNTHEAVRVLRQIIDLGKSEFEIMGMINWLLKSAYAVAAGNGPEFKLNPFVAKKVGPLADKLGLEKVRDAFSLCMDTEVLFRTTGVKRALALELLVIKLSASRPRRKAPARR